ncbi:MULTISPECIES: DUF6268 family outer membrane beta-barrel protein [Chitinophagaceae]
MKKYFFTVLQLIIFVGVGFSQTGTSIDHTATSDSARKNVMEDAAIQNPQLRQITLSADVIGRSVVHTDVNGNRLLDANVDQIRTASLFNIPVIHWDKNTVGLSILTLQQIAHFRDVSSTVDLSGIDLNYNKLTVGTTVSFSRRDSLLGLPIYYNAAISALSNDVKSVKKMSYLAGLTFALKQTPTTRFMFGAMLNIDPSLNIPVIPIISYWHKFGNELELNLNLPTQVNVKKQFGNRLWVNAGTSITGSLAFFDIDKPNIPQQVNLSSLELKTGIGVEYRLMKKIMIGANAGYLSNLQSRGFDRHLRINNYFLKNTYSSVPYANLTISILPFL